MLTHKELVEKALSDPAVKAEYDRLEPEFALLDELLKAREEAGLTQAELAERMGTKPPAISRLMNGLGNGNYSPSVATLRKYAEACGKKLSIRLE
jgi:transcriptional regulator with XRE-family HTH domain